MINNHADALYICTTPFQIMSSISLALVNKEHADICIDPQFNDANRYISNISKEKVFLHVYNAEDSKSLLALRRSYKSFFQKAFLALELFHGKRIYTELIHGHKKYKTIYTSSNNEITRYLMNYVIKKHWETELVFFDDGEGSYDDDAILGFGRKKRTRKNKLLVKEIEEKPYRFLLYSPEYYKAIHPDYTNVIEQLPKWNENIEIQNIISTVFELDDVDDIPEKCILLDTLCDETFDKTDSQKYKKIIKSIIESIGVDNICIKKHPRDCSKNEYGIREYNNRTIPFECLTLKMKNDEKVLIALSSTVVFMPKILMNKEYNILLLYRMFEMNIGNDIYRNKLYSTFKNDYSDQSKIMIPNNERELLLCLQRIKEQDGKPK